MTSDFDIADLSWKESVARIVLSIVQQSGILQFSIEQVYEHEHVLELRFPGNRHVREKMRQSLQKLVADGILIRTAKGVYQLNTGSPELVVDHQLPAGIVAPKQVLRITKVRLRNTLLAIEVKKRYDYKCQACGCAVALIPPNWYAEGHHLRPLGRDHLGPDTAENIIVLCPNHHTMFDAGAAAVEPETHRLLHARFGVFEGSAILRRLHWHNIDPAFVEYHFTKIYQGGIGG